jgi:hypothetical protein
VAGDPLPAGRYSYAQLEGLWINAGGPKSQAPVAAAIAEAESGGNPNARNPSGASGLWQILGAPSGVSGNMFDPAVNARMAVAKYDQAGNRFTPWVTFTNGAYRGFLSGKTTPNLNVPSTGKFADIGGKGSNVGPNPSECAWAIGWGGIPGTSWLADIFGQGGNLGSGQICLLSKSAFRGLIGVGLITGAGLLLALPGVALLLAAATVRASPAIGTALEGVGGAVALIPGAEPLGVGIAGAGVATKHAGKSSAKKRSESRKERAAKAEARQERAMGEPRENPDLRVGRGAIRETPRETRARRTANPGPPASAAEAGF